MSENEMPKPDYYDNVRMDVINLIPNQSYEKILEIGGGSFSTLLKLKEMHGSECWGVDIFETNASGITFINGNIEDDNVNAKIPNQSFGLALANDVVEHLADTEKALKNLHRSLLKGGILALSVPNARQLRFSFNVLIRGTFPRNSSGMFDRTHLRWFCKSDIENMVRNTGFEIVDAVNVGGLVPRIISRSFLAQLLGLQTIIIAKKI
jgi:ubiquinone/menaquinone biosynthesis C-methylase UbiE